MRIACPYCGRIHDRRFDCGRRPKADKKRDAADGFRSTRAWQKRREEIRRRDRNLCRWCLAAGTLTYGALSVHHIEPLEEAWALRMEESNLITLCSCCHEQAEAGKIPRDALHRLAVTAAVLPPASGA